jgi:ATP-dependent Clp protease ATP-binding subunit ClpA
VNFKNTIIIMTTNLGSQVIMQHLGESECDTPAIETREREKARVTKSLRKKPGGEKEEVLVTDTPSRITPALREELMQIFRSHFRPEFLNRVDDIVIFNPISSLVLRHIVDVQLTSYIALVKKEKDIDITITDEAKDAL